MKKVVWMLFFLIISSCINQKKVISNVIECTVQSAPAEDIHLKYLSLRADSDFYKNEFVNFSRIKDGVLLYRWQEGTMGEGQFLIIDFEKGLNILKNDEKSLREVNFSAEEKKNLQSIAETLKKESYYQVCEPAGHSTVSVLIVRVNNEEMVQYFSPSRLPFGIETLDANVDSIKEIFRILERGLYRKI